ncbi:MAG: EamA family transporter, partial [Verrucomicrobiales bacterium]|nr:EamA family transporter [Verrucomicrobiales bacterium]
MLLRANLMLLVTAFIWGFGFVAQDEAMNYLDAYSFNAFRFLLGALSLLPLVYFSGKRKASSFNAGKPFWVIGGLAGIALLFGATLQQLGIDILGNDPNEATEGKAGFITGLYLVIVPLIGFCLRQKIDKLTVGGVLLATYGLYLLSIKEGLTIGQGDSLVLIGAFFWAVHVQVVGYAAKYNLDPLKLAVLQYLICAVLSFGLYLINYRVLEIEADKLSLQSTMDASGAILFAGFVSVGVAYTLQIIAQKH